MPQLNPNPGFFISLPSWLIFSVIVQPKLPSFIPTNPPSNNALTALKTTLGTWPWT